MALLYIGMFLVVVTAIASLGYWGMTVRDEKARALKRARATLARIDKLAWDAREIDTYLSVQVIDEIRQHQEGKYK